MKTATQFLLVVFTLGAGAAPVLAANGLTTNAGISVNTAVTSSTGTGISANAGAASNATTTHPDNYGGLISSLQTGASVDVASINSASTIDVVTVSSLKANGNSNALTNALKKNHAAVASLQASVAANATLKSKLTASGFKTSQVIGLVSGADGSVTVYVDDRA